MGISVTPIPRLTVLTVPAFTLGTANAAGSAVTAVASDSTLLAFDTTVPTTIASGASAAAGSASTVSHRDHNHGAFTVTAAATQAEQEAGTSTTTFTSPGRQQFHPTAPKAWCRITPANALVAGSYNIASITDHAAGNRLIVFDVDFADALHVPVCGLVIDVNDFSERFENFAVGSVQQLMALGTTLTDCGSGSAHYGDQSE